MKEVMIHSKICRIDHLDWDVSEVIVNNSTTSQYKKIRDGFHDTPLGVYYWFISQSKGTICSFRKNHLLNSKLLLVSFNPITDSKRRKVGINRQLILANLQKNGFLNKLTSTGAYFRDVGMYKFVASPEGKGLDCHRHYEAWLSGGVPIIEDNVLMREKYHGLPILWTEDYSEITENYLNERYVEFEKEIFDFRKLFLDYYSEEKQKEIKARGNHWINKHTGRKNYYG